MSTAVAPKVVADRALIAAWLPIDADELRPMIAAFLEYNAERGSDILPTKFNVERFLDMGLGWATAGFPTLHAVADGKIVAWLAWGPLMQNFESVHPDTILALGSFTDPEYRQHRLQAALKSRAIIWSRELGATRIMGPMLVGNDKGIAEMESFGAVSSTVTMELGL